MLQILKKQSFKLYATYPFILLLIVLFIHSKPFYFNFTTSLDPYLYSSWLFDYKYGFMQRGLIGNLLNSIGISREYNTIRIIAIFILLLMYYLFYFLILKTLLKLGIKNKDIKVYITCFFFLSFTLSQFILELARFDQIFQIISLIFLTVILHSKKIIYSYIYILTIIPLITLIHEAGIIIFIPTILTIFYLEYKKIKPIVFFSLLSIICIGLISHFGKINTDHAQIMINNYNQYKAFNEFAFRTTSLSLYENFLMSWHSFIEKKMIIPIILALLIIYPIILFICNSISNKKYLFLFIFALSPLSLSLVAFDYFRWISLSLFNIFIILIYLINKNLITAKNLSDNLEKNKKWIIYYSLFSLFLGPLGVVNLYPHIHHNNNGGLSSINLPQKTQEKLNYIK